MMTSILRGRAAGPIAALAVAAVSLLLTADAFAGGFTVNPTRVYIEGQKKSAVINVTNDGERDADFQLSAVSWGQDEQGKNVFSETKEIIFFPKITRVKAGETKTIRVGYQGGPGAVEKTYRVFMQELAPPTDDRMSLGFTVKMSVPIFIVPAKPVSGASIEDVRLTGAGVTVTFANTGNTHLVVNRVAAVLLDADGEEILSAERGGWYVLAGRSGNYSMKVPREQCLRAASVRAVVETGGARFERRVDVDSSGCEKD